MYHRLRGVVATIVMTLIAAPTWAASTPEVAPPPPGPRPVNAKPLILIEQAINQKSYGSHDPIAALMSGISNAAYSKSAAATQQAVSAAYPQLGWTKDIEAGFACGAAGSLCTELVKLEPAAGRTVDDALRELLANKNWAEARVLTVWWHRDGDYMAARGSVVEVVRSAAGELQSMQPVLIGHYFMSPKLAAKAKNPQRQMQEWAAGAELPSESAMHTAIGGLAPLARMALSWGANNDPKAFPGSFPLLQKMRASGLGHDGLRLGVALYLGVVDDRVWTWLIQHESPDTRKYGRFVYELQSRPWLNP